MKSPKASPNKNGLQERRCIGCLAKGICRKVHIGVTSGSPNLR